MNQETNQKTSGNKKRSFKHKMDFFINTKLSIWGSKIATQRYIAALRDSFVAYSPFVIVGSFFLVFSQFPVDGWSQLQENVPWLGSVLAMPKKVTYDIMSFWIVALYAYNLSRHYKMNPLFPMIGSAMTFLLLIPLQLADINGVLPEWTETKSIPLGGYAGTSGILLALFTGIVVTEWFRFCQKKNVHIPLPEAVPPAVRSAFSAMIPIVILIIGGILMRGLIGLTPWHYLPLMIEKFIGSPISGGFLGQLGGVTLLTFLQMFGWCFGINSGTVNGIARPFEMAMLPGNIAAYQCYLQTGVYHWAGEPFMWDLGDGLKNYVAQIGTEDFYNFSNYGGAGTTVGICFFLAIFAKSEKLKTIARVSVIPGIFSINEPFMFGIPIVLNPLMWPPLLIAPVLETIVAYCLMDWHVVPIPVGALNPWTLPFGMLGYFTNLHWSGAVLQLFNVSLASFIWYPFVKYADQEAFKEENNLQDVKTTQVFKIAKRLGILPPVIGALKNEQYFENLVNQKPYNINYANLLRERESLIKETTLLMSNQILELDKTITEENKKEVESEIKGIRTQLKQKNAEIKVSYKPELGELKQQAHQDRKAWNAQIKDGKKENVEKLKTLKSEWKLELSALKKANQEQIKLERKDENLMEVEKLKAKHKKSKLDFKKRKLDAQYILESEIYKSKVKVSKLQSNYYKEKYKK